MTVAELRKELKKRIDHLEESPLKSAADYLAYLEESTNPQALGMTERIRRAENEVARGLVTPVSKLRRKY